MPLASRVLEWTTLAAAGLAAIAAGSYWVLHSVSLAAVQSVVAAGLLIMKDSWLVELFTLPTPLVQHSQESQSMPKFYQTLAAVQADLPDLVTVLTDFVAVSKLIESKDVVGIIGSYAKWEADVVKLVNDIRAGTTDTTPGTLPPATTTVTAAAPTIAQSAPSGSIFVQTSDAPATASPSLAAQAGLPESAK